VNCDWASWSTTMVIEKTSPVTEIIALAMVERRLRAPSGPPSKMYGTSKVNVPSTHGRTTARASAPRTIARGEHPEGPPQPLPWARPIELRHGATLAREFGADHSAAYRIQLVLRSCWSSSYSGAFRSRGSPVARAGSDR
jgi:hypothetical protein